MRVISVYTSVRVCAFLKRKGMSFKNHAALVRKTTRFGWTHTTRRLVFCIAEEPDPIHTTIMIFFFLFITEEFVEVIKQTTLHQKVPFNFDSEFVKMYFGRERKRAVNYVEFSQFLHVSYLLMYQGDLGNEEQ